MRWVITKIQLENRAAKTVYDTTKHVSITYNKVADPVYGFERNITHVAVYKKSMNIYIFAYFFRGRQNYTLSAFYKDKRWNNLRARRKCSIYGR